MKTGRKQTLILLFMLCNFIVLGQRSKLTIDTSFTLSEVTISGYGDRVPLSKTPGNVNVITSNRLSRMPTQSIDEAIEMLPGVNSNRTSGLSQMVSTVSLRGLSGDEQSRTLVLVDGVPINTSDNGTVNWNAIHPDNVARIEVLKGGAAAMYGANAIGGVINIVTKRASSPITARASLLYGSLNTWRSNLIFSSKLSDRFSIFLGGNYNQSDGYVNVADSLRTQYTSPLFVNEYGVFTKLLFMPHKDWRLELSYSLYRDKRGEGEKILAPSGEYRNFDNDRITLKANTVGEKRWTMAYSCYLQQERYFKLDERMSGDNYQRFDVNAKRNDFGLLFNSSIKFGDNRLGFGAELRAGSIEGGDYYKTSTDTAQNSGELDLYSLYVRDEQTFIKDKLWVQFVLRYDLAQFHGGVLRTIGSGSQNLDNHTWYKFSPNLSLRYTPSERFSTYLTYGRGFRASTLDDLCRSGWMWVGPKIANPELGPEYMDSYEWGMQFNAGRFKFDKSLYYGLGHDFLYYVPTGEKMYGKRDIFIRKNISKVCIYGGESELSYDNSNGLYMSLNYTMSYNKILKANGMEHLEGKQLTYAPRYMLKFSTIFTGTWGEASLKTSYKSKQYVSEDNSKHINGYFMCDIAVAKWFFDHHIYAKGEVLNIFDCRKTNSLEYLAPGRLFNIKIAINI